MDQISAPARTDEEAAQAGRERLAQLERIAAALLRARDQRDALVAAEEKKKADLHKERLKWVEDLFIRKFHECLDKLEQEVRADVEEAAVTLILEIDSAYHPQASYLCGKNGYYCHQDRLPNVTHDMIVCSARLDNSDIAGRFRVVCHAKLHGTVGCIFWLVSCGVLRRMEGARRAHAWRGRVRRQQARE